MDLTTGFALKTPALFVPWEVSEPELKKFFAGHLLKRVTHGYYVTDCEPFAGLRCSLGFHLHGTPTLNELEFFKRDFPDMRKSYDDFQFHLEATFGKPTNTKNGPVGFLSHTWLVPGARIIHHVIERFTPEEHVRITPA